MWQRSQDKVWPPQNEFSTRSQNSSIHNAGCGHWTILENKFTKFMLEPFIAVRSDI